MKRFWVLLLVLILSGCDSYHRPTPSPLWTPVPEEEKSITFEVEESDFYLASFEVVFNLDSPFPQGNGFPRFENFSKLCIGDRYILEATFKTKAGYDWQKTCVTDYGGPGWRLIKLPE